MNVRYFFILAFATSALLVPAHGGRAQDQWRHGEWYGDWKGEARYDANVMTLTTEMYPVSYYFAPETPETNKESDSANDPAGGAAETPVLLLLTSTTLEDEISDAAAREFAELLSSWLVMRAPALETTPNQNGGKYRARVYFQSGKLPPKNQTPGFAGTLPLAEELKRLNSPPATVMIPRGKFFFITGEEGGYSFDRMIFLSPSTSMLTLEENIFAGKKLLWIGSAYEQKKLELLAEKFGGDIMVYPMAGANYEVFQRNHLALEEVQVWLTQP